MSIAPIDPRIRFWRYANPDPNTGCWHWSGYIDPGGYGRFCYFGRKMVLAHRASYKMFCGPIQEGMTLDHLCRERSCVNPEHLEVVTRGENTLRGETFTAKNKAKTHCPRGHEYSIENTIRTKGGHGRNCRECNRVRCLRLYYRSKAAAGRADEDNRRRVTEEQVREIHRLGSLGFLQRDIAQRFGINKATVQRILCGDTWRRVYAEVTACGASLALLATNENSNSKGA